MLLTDATIAVVDFESTGTVSGYTDEPWQIGVSTIRNGRVLDNSLFSSLLRIGDRPFNPYAPGRHEVVRGQLAEAPTLHELWPELKMRLKGHALAAHNVSTERKFLSRAFPLHRTAKWVDTLTLVRRAYPDLRSNRLQDVTQRLGLAERVRAFTPELAPHDALYDAVACAVLLEHIMALPGWDAVELESLP